MGEGDGTRGTPPLVARAGQRTVPVLEAGDAVMCSGFMGTAAKFEATVIYCEGDVGSDEGDEG